MEAVSSGMIGYVSGGHEVSHSLSRPPEWEPAHKLVAKPPAVAEIDVDGEREAATRFGVRPTHTVRSVVHTVLGLLFAALTAGSIVLAVDDPTGDAVVGSIVLLVFAGAFLFAGSAAIVSARRGLGLDLTPTSVVVGLGGDRSAFGWAEISQVTATTESGGDVILISVRDGHETKVPCRKLKADPVLVFHTLRFYAAHPQQRSELGGDDSRARISAGRLT